MFHVYHYFRIGSSESEVSKHLQAPADGWLSGASVHNITEYGLCRHCVRSSDRPASASWCDHSYVSTGLSWSSLHSPGHTTDAACCPGRVLVAVTTVSCPHALSRGPGQHFIPTLLLLHTPRPVRASTFVTSVQTGVSSQKIQKKPTQRRPPFSIITNLKPT